MSVENDLAIIGIALTDAAPGTMPEHDAMCRTNSGWPDQQEKGCNCWVARNVTAREALARIRKIAGAPTEGGDET